MSSSSSSWSDLPLDLLICIKNKLHPSYPNNYDISHPIDQISFRSVCSHWRSAIPIPNSLPQYRACLSACDNTVHFNTCNKNGYSVIISLPFTTSSWYHLDNSNGWIILKPLDINIIHIFNPVSNLKLTFPALSQSIFFNYNNFKPTPGKRFFMKFLKVVVSSSAANGVAVAGILGIGYEEDFKISEKRLVYCRHGDGGRWHFLMKDVVDVDLAGDDCFYVIDKYKLYTVDEKPPLIKLKRLEIWAPKKILEAYTEENQTNKLNPIFYRSMQACGESKLHIYGSRRGILRRDTACISLELDVTKLRCNNGVACEAQWFFWNVITKLSRQFFFNAFNFKNFIPSLSNLCHKKLKG